MRQYELVVLLHPDLEIDLDKPLKTIEKTVKELGGKVQAVDVWGKRKLAYPINKEDFAVYAYYEIELPPSEVARLERALNISEEVIRYLVTHPVPKIGDDDDKSRAKKEKEASKSQAGEKAKAAAVKSSTKAKEQS